MALLEQLSRGIKVVQAKRGKSIRTRLPPILRVLRGAWLTGNNMDAYDVAMLWAACSLCFFGFFRSGELISPSDLLFQDIAFNDIGKPSIMQVHLKASKTDPFRTGVDVYVGKTNNDLCPLTAMVHYLSMRGGGDGPLFVYRNGRFLTRESLVVRIRDALNSSGIDASNYSGHRFRSGAATTALQAGVSDAAIQMLGRWRSDAYKRYIKTPRDQLAAFSMHLVQSVY